MLSLRSSRPSPRLTSSLSKAPVAARAFSMNIIIAGITNNLSAEWMKMLLKGGFFAMGSACDEGEEREEVVFVKWVGVILLPLCSSRLTSSKLGVGALGSTGIEVSRSLISMSIDASLLWGAALFAENVRAKDPDIMKQFKQTRGSAIVAMESPRGRR